MLLSVDFGPLAFICSLLMHGADYLPVVRFRVVIHGTYVVLGKGQRTVTVHSLRLKDVRGLLIDQLLVRHVIKSLLVLLCLQSDGVLLLLFLLTFHH